MLSDFAVLSSPFCFHHVGISLLINNNRKKKKGNTLIDDYISQHTLSTGIKDQGIFRKVDIDG
jgi:hypothetical protein